MLTKEKKIEYIKENKDAAVVAVTSYLDAIYSIKEKFLNEDGTLREELPKDEKAENFIKSMQHDAAMQMMEKIAEIYYESEKSPGVEIHKYCAVFGVRKCKRR